MTLKPSEIARIELVAAYIAELGLMTIHLIAAASHPDAVRFDVSQGLRCDAHRADASILVLDAFVFDSQGHAEIVAGDLQDQAPFPGLDAARKAVIEAAAAAGASWRTKAQVLGEASAEVDGINFHLRGFKESGGLKAFNAAYKKYRKRCMDAAQSAIQYSVYLHQYTLKIVALVASNVAAGRERFANVHEVMPDALPTVPTPDHCESRPGVKVNFH